MDKERFRSAAPVDRSLCSLELGERADTLEVGCACRSLAVLAGEGRSGCALERGGAVCAVAKNPHSACKILSGE